MWCAPSSFLIPNWYTHGFCLCRKQELCGIRTEGWRFFRVSPLSFSFVCFCLLPRSWSLFCHCLLLCIRVLFCMCLCLMNFAFVFAENYSSKWWWGLEIGGVAPLQSLAIPSRHSPLQGYPPTLNTHNTLIFKTKEQTWIGDSTLPKAQLTQQLGQLQQQQTVNGHTLLRVTKKFHFVVKVFIGWCQAVASGKLCPNYCHCFSQLHQYWILMSHFKRSYCSSSFFKSTLWRGQTLDFFERDFQKRGNIREGGGGDLLLRNKI